MMRSRQKRKYKSLTKQIPQIPKKYTVQEAYKKLGLIDPVEFANSHGGKGQTTFDLITFMVNALNQELDRVVICAYSIRYAKDLTEQARQIETILTGQQIISYESISFNILISDQYSRGKTLVLTYVDHYCPILWLVLIILSLCGAFSVEQRKMVRMRSHLTIKLLLALTNRGF